jgi:serine protease
MDRSSLIREVTLLAAVAFAASLVVPRAHAQALPTPARVIVKYKADSALVTKAAMSADAKHALQARTLGALVGLVLPGGAGVAERTHVVTAEGLTSRELADRLSAEPDIEYAVPDELRHFHAVPNDPLYVTGPPLVGSAGGPAVGQWYLRAPNSFVQSAINAEQAWNFANGSNVVVAVLDTGVRFDHPDLQRVEAGGRLLPGYDMISSLAVANDGDERDADPTDPGDWLSFDDVQPGATLRCSTTPTTSSWHGTKTSALIGAIADNGIGMAGVASGARILPVRVLGKCGGYDSDILAGMLWAAGIDVPGVPRNATPARILNLSLGGEGPCNNAYRDTVGLVNAVGAVVVASAGNSVGHTVGMPANCPGVIAVGGLRHAGTKVGFSDLGPDIAISAPAGNCINIGAGEPCLYPILTASNTGLTEPVADALGGSTYTDSFNASVGTSFAAPLVTGTAALMLSVQPSLTPARLRLLLQASARPFPTTGGDNGDGTVVPQCAPPQPVGFAQVDQLQCYCTTATCGAGMLDAGAAVLAAQAVTTPNYTGLFWNAPANSEPGWGINFIHEGDQIFATWFTYDTAGKPWWLLMLARPAAPNSNVYTGDISVATGPPFSNFVGAQVETQVGNGTLTFFNADSASFSYVVNGVAQTKALTRFNMGTGPMPACSYSAAPPNLAAATNYQDMWWVPRGAESGWGINLIHQGETIFATWFTYNLDHTPLWLTALAFRQPNGSVYAGTVYRDAGPRFDAYDAAKLVEAAVGTASFTFANGNDATFAYSVTYPPLTAPVTQQKRLTRFQFAPTGGLICQ